MRCAVAIATRIFFDWPIDPLWRNKIKSSEMSIVKNRGKGPFRVPNIWFFSLHHTTLQLDSFQTSSAHSGRANSAKLTRLQLHQAVATQDFPGECVLDWTNFPYVFPNFSYEFSKAKMPKFHGDFIGSCFFGVTVRDLVINVETELKIRT